PHRPRLPVGAALRRRRRPGPPPHRRRRRAARRPSRGARGGAGRRVRRCPGPHRHRAPHQDGRTVTTTLLPAPAREAVRAERRRRRWRTAVVTVALAGVVLALAWTALSWGGHAAEAADHLAGLLGGGSGEDSFTIGRIRLPRVALAVLVGVALGVAGGIFQTVLGNPLASPDILGVSGGASAAAAFAIVVLGLSGLLVGLAALLGAAAAATLIYLLAWRGGVTGYRFVLVGVGIAFAVNGLVG